MHPLFMYLKITLNFLYTVGAPHSLWDCVGAQGSGAALTRRAPLPLLFLSDSYQYNTILKDIDLTTAADCLYMLVQKNSHQFFNEKAAYPFGQAAFYGGR